MSLSRYAPQPLPAPNQSPSGGTITASGAHTDSCPTGATSGDGNIWRVGANVTTRIKTEADLEINGTKVPAGEYSFFVELAEGSWTAILSNQPHMEAWNREKVAQGITWGSYGYSPDHDVVRAPMSLSKIDMSVDQMSIFFADVTEEGGSLAVVWEDQMALLPFRVAQ